VFPIRIKCNQPLADRYRNMFELAKEFVYSGYKDLQVDMRFYESKRYGLSFTGLFIMKGDGDLSPVIKINNYAIRTKVQAIILSDITYSCSLEEQQYRTVFHDFAHLIRDYNHESIDWELFQHKLDSDETAYNPEEEKVVDGMAEEFLASKGIIESTVRNKYETTGT
jgi:hypothetical protein